MQVVRGLSLTTFTRPGREVVKKSQNLVNVVCERPLIKKKSHNRLKKNMKENS